MRVLIKSKPRIFRGCLAIFLGPPASVPYLKTDLTGHGLSLNGSERPPGWHEALPQRAHAFPWKAHELCENRALLVVRSSLPRQLEDLAVTGSEAMS